MNMATPFLAVPFDPIDEDNPLQFPALGIATRRAQQSPADPEPDAECGAGGGSPLSPVANPDAGPMNPPATGDILFHSPPTAALVLPEAELRFEAGAPLPPTAALLEAVPVPSVAAPVAAFPILPGTAAGGSIGSVLQERLRQVEKFGHTPEADAERSLREFLRGLQSLATAAAEDHHFHPNDLTRLRQRVVKAGAMALATIDRIDFQLREDERDARELFA